LYREIFEKFAVLTRGVGMELLQLLCEAMGLRRPDYFAGGLSGGDVILSVNHYPRCPNPDVTLGLPPHCDRNLITLVHTGPVHGLEVLYNGDWIKVEPMANALVVNFGLQLEVN
jgi:2'-deoxymugineic-acid 2'-dioxygenase/mugineic-acid 3-dioxygenase